MYTVKMVSGSMIYIQGFMTISPGIQVIEGYYPNNLRSCTVGITEGIGFIKYAIE
jgi:hypothetical protein